MKAPVQSNIELPEPFTDDSVIGLQYSRSRGNRGRTPVVLHSRARHWSRVAIIALPILILSFWVHILLSAVALLVLCVSSVAALGLCWLAIRRSARLDVPEIHRVPRRQSSRTLATASILTLIALGLLAVFASMTERLARSLSSISVSNSCLRGLESGLFIHADDVEPPNSLWDLVSSSTRHAGQLIAPMDPKKAIPGGPPSDYTSYVFFPPDPGYYDDGRPSNKIILLFERGAWHQQDARLLGDSCRCVQFLSFADCVDQREFPRMIEEDRKARRERGWPVYDWDETTGEVRQIE